MFLFEPSTFFKSVFLIQLSRSKRKFIRVYYYYYLIGRQIIRIPWLLAPRAFDGVSIDIGIVNCNNGVRGGFLRWKSGEEEGEGGAEILVSAWQLLITVHQLYLRQIICVFR